MDYIKPQNVLKAMIESGRAKAHLKVSDLLLRGALAGALLGVATSLAITATVQTTIPLCGAIIFPVGFAMIVLLGLELVTGNFALLPIACHAGKITPGKVVSNWLWVFIGNLIGSLLYAALLWIVLTNFGAIPPSGIAAKIAAVAEAKTIGYTQYGFAGIVTLFVKAILCNWLVCLGAVMAMTSSSTIGKIVGAWLPILTFFAQGFEHSVVNMFVIPAGMFFGAKVTLSDWLLSNQLPVTLGNIVGGYVLTGLVLYLTYKPSPESSEKEEAL